MKKNWLWTVMLLSLAVNLGVLGTLAVRWISPPKHFSEEGQVQEDSLLWDNSELTSVIQQLQSIRRENRPLIEKSQQTHERFAKSLAIPDFNPIKTKTYLRDYLAARSALEASLGNSLMDIRAGMTDTIAIKYFNKRMERRVELRERLRNRIEQRNKIVQPTQADSISTPRERLLEKRNARILGRRRAFRNRQSAD